MKKQKKKMRAIQQGDVFIEAIRKIPADAIDGKLKNGQIILAEGETTGHAHRISKVANVIFKEKDGFFYLQNKEELKVTHEEHKPIIIPPGVWEVKRVLEYDHFEEEVWEVRD